MTLFDENTTVEPAPRQRWGRRTTAGAWAVCVALIVLLVISFLPTAYVIQQKGPVYNTLGTAQNADREDVPLISVDDAETYPTAGSLDLLTVQVVGNRERTPSWYELAAAWFDPSRAVVPIDSIFPAGQTTEQRNEDSVRLMVDSQKEATAAALSELGYDVETHPSVYSVSPGSAAEGLLENGDLILTVDGEPASQLTDVSDRIAAGAGDPVAMTIERSGQEQAVEITPRQEDVNGEQRWIVGIQLMTDFDFPIDVDLQLNNVGGPSAGMMFALGIIDVLTPGELNGGQQVAGTGTIDANGVVGAIGGIRQKLYGAKDAGAQYFLAPESNCNEVVGHVPDGLRVFSVATLDDSLAVLDAIRDGGDLDALATCAAS
ncbi:YlbL family protein [Microbacterium hatanonis]|uniref:endopeptidase La n=1 Tax=Microbacterium hatanonis TaxID=404366 RepID=A0A5C8I520_9MICO|nr:PDZ domain-containing protein [Microbacterium hatanonis]TXK13399.1 PDZ domain-containing protein [Microbacterium hatanonis]